jgi:hypothetical protein
VWETTSVVDGGGCGDVRVEAQGPCGLGRSLHVHHHGEGVDIALARRGPGAEQDAPESRAGSVLLIVGERGVHGALVVAPGASRGEDEQGSQNADFGDGELVGGADRACLSIDAVEFATLEWVYWFNHRTASGAPERVRATGMSSAYTVISAQPVPPKNDGAAQSSSTLKLCGA